MRFKKRSWVVSEDDSGKVTFDSTKIRFSSTIKKFDRK
ncbi:protein of unknown function [Tenacibaculum sp. 190524A02b]